MSASQAPATGQRLADKVAIVTGAASGLGRAIALAFAAQGTRLVVCADLHPITAGTELGAEDAGTPTHEVICQRQGANKAIFVKTDVTDGGQIKALIEEAVKAGGRLDIMVNNAGITGGPNLNPVQDVEEEIYDRVMAVNARSVFLGCKHSVAQFLRQEPHPSGHRGWIVNTASIMGLVGTRAVAYCASKGAVVLMTKAVAVEQAKDKIHCNALCPGYLTTPMIKDMDPETRAILSAVTPWGDFGDAADAAKAAVFLASEDADYVTGIALPVDGGYTAQ
ncbi:2-(R)-hydroxypropyl-coM dehydrogenase [Physcia stellaris]|nr:2-(R)-hydroxypropyl-coM dehydrogenase [Physcia stellaris]